ncbi:MAG: CpsD/CapB family tyrosine-protein kinase [Phycisphaerae bacterium]
MGRIADALKRAEQERRMAAETLSCGTAVRQASVQTSYATEAVRTSWPALNPPRAGEAVCPVDRLSDDLVPFFDRSALVTEQYRALRTRLLSQNPDYEHRAIAITSAVPKEGKSVTTLNLGCVLAEIRHLKVLVVDGDLRRGSLAEMLNEQSKPGLAEIFSGEATYSEVIRDTAIPNLKFIPAGDISGRSAAELWTAASAKPVFHHMRNDFHYTIVDTPPTTTVTDVGMIGQLCTGVMIVIRLHHTDEPSAKRAVRLLQVNNIPITGCVLVGRDAPVDGYGYGYGYGYHHYTDKQYDNQPEGH